VKSLAVLIIICTPIMFLLCTNPPAISYTQVQNITDSLIISKSPQKIKGAGVVAIKIGNKKYSGNADVEWEKRSTFRADFYSPLGTVVASIYGDTINGSFDCSEKTYTFKFDSTMDSLPFAWAREFTFNEFSELLTGNLSSSVKILNTKPYIVRDSGRFAIANWKPDFKNFIVTVLIDRKKLLVESVVFESTPKLWTMTFYNFNKGIAYSMLFKDGENNYFSLEYDKLKYF
jgi:hypothetical protein